MSGTSEWQQLCVEVQSYLYLIPNIIPTIIPILIIILVMIILIPIPIVVLIDYSCASASVLRLTCPFELVTFG